MQLTEEEDMGMKTTGIAPFRKGRVLVHGAMWAKVQNIYHKMCLLFRCSLDNYKVLLPITHPCNPIVSENVINVIYPVYQINTKLSYTAHRRVSMVSSGHHMTEVWLTAIVSITHRNTLSHGRPGANNNLKYGYMCISFVSSKHQTDLSH